MLKEKILVLIIMLFVVLGLSNVDDIYAQPYVGSEYNCVHYIDFSELVEACDTPIEKTEILVTSQKRKNNNITNGYYYSLLDGTEKNLYACIIEAAKNIVPYNTSATAEYYVKVYEGENDNPITSEQFNRARYAVIYDHMDEAQFSLCQMKFPSRDEETTDGKRIHYIYMYMKPLAEYDFSSMKNSVIAAKDEFLTSIGNSRYKAVQELLLHDVIRDTISYDKECERKNSPYDTGHTIYGALVEKSCVCDGYAQAFAYLYSELGGTAKVVVGQAGTSGHAWNVICLEDNWYDMDITFDKQIGNGCYDYFNKTTAEFSLKRGGRAKHERKLLGNSVPIANGTKYTYEYVSCLREEEEALNEEETETSDNETNKTDENIGNNTESKVSVEADLNNSISENKGNSMDIQSTPALITKKSIEKIDKKQKKTKITKLKAEKGAITVKWKKQTTKEIIGYEIQYSTNKSFKKSVKKVRINKNTCASKKIKKLKAKKKYYVRIRTVKKAENGKVYSTWSKVKRVKVK